MGTHNGHEDELATEADDERDGELQLLLHTVRVSAAADAEGDEDGDGGSGAVEDEVGGALAPHGGHGELGGGHGLDDVALLVRQLTVVRQQRRVLVHHGHRHGRSADVKCLNGEVVLLPLPHFHHQVAREPPVSPSPSSAAHRRASSSCPRAAPAPRWAPAAPQHLESSMVVAVVAVLTALVRAQHGLGDVLVAGRNHGPVGRGLVLTPCRCRRHVTAATVVVLAVVVIAVFLVVVVVVALRSFGSEAVVGGVVEGDAGCGADLLLGAAFDLGAVEIHALARAYLQSIDRWRVELNEEELIAGRGQQAVAGHGQAGGHSSHVQHEADRQPQAPPSALSGPGPRGPGCSHLRVSCRTARRLTPASSSLSPAREAMSQEGATLVVVRD